LIDRVYALMLVAMLPLKGKTAAEIPDKSQGEPGTSRRVWYSDCYGGIPVLSMQLSRDLSSIAHIILKLNKVRFRAFKDVFSPAFFAKPSADQIQDCTNKLDWAIIFFDVDEARINDALHTFNDIHNIREDIQDVHANAKNIESGIRIQEETRGIHNAVKALPRGNPIEPNRFSPR
jgi:hypothetical protein